MTTAQILALLQLIIEHTRPIQKKFDSETLAKLLDVLDLLATAGEAVPAVMALLARARNGEEITVAELAAGRQAIHDAVAHFDSTTSGGAEQPATAGGPEQPIAPSAEQPIAPSEAPANTE